MTRVESPLKTRFLGGGYDEEGFSLFGAVGCCRHVLTIAPGQSVSAQQRQANGAVPLQKLSLEERATTSPDSTVVKFRNQTYKLGDLRAAHKTRTTSLNAHASGLNTA